MNNAAYQEWTKSTLRDPGNNVNRDLLHGVIGLTTETGELADLVKKMLFTNKIITRDMIVDEVGDSLYYIATVLRAVGGTFEEAMVKNMAKLTVRYVDNKGEKNKEAEAAAQASA